MSCWSSSEVNHSSCSFTFKFLFNTSRKRQNTKAKYNNLRDRIQWFKDQLNTDQTHLSKQEVHQLVEQFVEEICSSIRFY